MPYTARQLANACLIHGPNIIPAADDEMIDAAALPAGCKEALADAINQSFDEMRREAPSAFRYSLGVNWTTSASGPVTATINANAVGMAGGLPIGPGSTVLIEGDSAYNELATAADPVTQIGQLLFAYTGSSGVKTATAWGDSVLLPSTVDYVLGAQFASNGRALTILGSRQAWLAYQGPRGRGDYGFANDTPSQERQVGEPRGVWIENSFNPTIRAREIRARCAPMPDRDTRAVLEVMSGYASIAAADFDEPGEDESAPTYTGPGGRDSILLALVLFHWSGKPWMADSKSRAVIGTNYQKAIADLRSYRVDASTQLQIVPG